MIEKEWKYEVQEKLEEKYKETNTLPKVNVTDMTGEMESIEEYLRLHCCVMNAPLTYVLRKNDGLNNWLNFNHMFITSKTPNDEMIIRV